MLKLLTYWCKNGVTEQPQWYVYISDRVFASFISGFVLIQLQPPFVHFLCRQGLCNARSSWRLSVMRGWRIGQSRERSSLDYYTPGTLLNTGANRDHSNKSSQLLPNGKSAAPALLPSESVLSIGCWLNTLWDFFKEIKMLEVTKVFVHKTVNKGIYFVTLKLLNLSGLR